MAEEEAYKIVDTAPNTPEAVHTMEEACKRLGKSKNAPLSAAPTTEAMAAPLSGTNVLSEAQPERVHSTIFRPRLSTMDAEETSICNEMQTSCCLPFLGSVLGNRRCLQH